MKSFKLLMLALLCTFAQGTWAQTTYITDVILVGDDSEKEAQDKYDSFVDQGWTGIDVDLNQSAGGHYIYLLYKTNNSQYSSGVPITDFFLRVSKSADPAPDSFVLDGHTYSLANYNLNLDGDFKASKGDLNTNAGGDYKIHLYYTKDEFAPGSAVTSISVDENSDNALGENGRSTPCDLNKDAGGDYLYMHVTKALTTPVDVPDGGVYYIEHGWDDVNKKLTSTVRTLESREFDVLSGNKTGDLHLSAGNYVVRSNIHVSDVIFVEGNTNLILCDGAKLTVAKGVLVSPPEGQNCTLSIFGQVNNSGQLVNEQKVVSSLGLGGSGTEFDTDVYPGIGTFSGMSSTINFHGGTINVVAPNGYAAAIGNGIPSHDMGTINFYGGDITATGGCIESPDLRLGSAAIGTYNVRANGSINIYGGNITAISYFYGPGIGTGNYGNEGNDKEFSVTINGGRVLAQGGNNASGIGCGSFLIGNENFMNIHGIVQPTVETYMSGKTITINGGSVEAHGDSSGAGIGGGVMGVGGNVTINGGRVEAHGGDNGAGIGSGEGNEYPLDGGSLIINDGEVYAYGGEKGAGIGGGGICHGADVTVNGGKVYAYGGEDAAGIGSGCHYDLKYSPSNGGKLTVTGGEVYAYGNEDGAGIGGGSENSGANVTITGGIVVAEAGTHDTGYRAIGPGYDNDNYGQLTIGDLMMVSSERLATAAERKNMCWYRTRVRVEPCTHSFGSYGECATCNLISLADNADNSETISHWNNTAKSVVLTGRTLYKDGMWNTLTLPFSLTAEQIANYTDFAGAIIMELDTAEPDGTNGYAHITGFENGTLYLNFKTATSIEAGKPYIIKWPSGSNITNPVFSNVTISNSVTEVGSADGTLAFTGTYSPHTYTKENKSILFMGGGNTLYYPQSGASINACRAYFTLSDIMAGDPAANPVKEFVLNFGEDTETGIINYQLSIINSSEAGTWYSIDGRKLSKKPTQKGLYIHGNHKVLIP